MARASGTKLRDPVSRVLDSLIWMISEAPTPAGVREMADALGIPPSAAHRALVALTGRGLLEQNGAGRYKLSVEALRLARLAINRFPLAQVAQPFLKGLFEACNETVLLGILDSNRNEMMFGAAIESNSPLRYVVRVNEWMPLHLGASGLAILAFLPPDLHDAAVERAIRERASSGVGRSMDELMSEIETVRQRGYAFTTGQRIPGAVGFAAPIFQLKRAIIGDVCLTVPEYRFVRSREDQLAGLVMECARAISAELGASM